MDRADAGSNRISTGLIVGMAALIAGFAIVRYSGLSDAVASWSEDIAWTGFSLAAALRSFQSARSATKARHRRGWILLGCGAGSWFLGMLYIIVGQLRDPQFVPFPTPANWLFLGLAPAFGAGMFFLRATRPDHRLDGKRLADLGLIASSVMAIFVMALLDPLSATAQSAEALLFSLLDPALFTSITVFTFALFWLDDLDDLGAAAALLAAAISVHLVANLTYFRGVLVEGQPVLPIEPLWLVAFGLHYLAAHAYDRRQPRRRTPPRSLARRRRHGILEAALPAPLVAVMALFGLMFRDHLTERTMFVLIPLLLLFGLCLGFREWWVDRAEERTFRRLEASMDLTNQILAASPAAVFAFDPAADSRPTFFSGNVGTFLGIDDEESWDWKTRVHPDDYISFREHVEAAVEHGWRSFECRLRDAVGGFRWVNIRFTVHQTDEDAPLRLVGSLVDVDAVKRLEARLLRGQRMEALGRLSGGVAHDFNNLLTTILGYSELGMTDPDVSESSKESFAAVITAAERAHDLTRQLLAFSRRQDMQMEVIDLGERVRNMTSMLSRMLGEDVEVEVRTPSRVAAVRADPSQIEQVILNLVVNARDAMPSGGRLALEVDDVLLDPALAESETLRPGRYVRLSVTDSGTGMTEEVRERVFEPFFTTKPKGSGTGLGLATLHGVVKQHSGYVDVASRMGIGSTFRVYLPATDEAPREHDAAEPMPIGTGHETILVVDDEGTIPRLVRDALTPAGYNVLTAECPADAIAIAEEGDRSIDLLLTDVVMPGMRGRELAARMRKLRPELRVVFMSGYPDDSDLLQEVTGGGVPFLPKPLALGNLAAVLRRALDNPPVVLDAH